MPIAGHEVGLPGSIDDVDAGWFTSVLRTSGAIDGGTSVAEAKIEPFQVGVGLLGQLARASLTYDGGGGPATLIIKWPIDVPAQRAMADGMNVYEREARFYTELAPRSELRTAEVHAAMVAEDKSMAIIVMEDLSALRQADRTTGVTWDEARTAIRTLARFHAGWHESDELDDIGATWFKLTDPLYNVVLPQFLAAGWEPCQRHRPELLDDDLIAFGDDWVELLPAMQEQLMTAPTLSHADWRSDNMFFDGRDELVMVDFQLLGVANGAYDLGYFVCQSVERGVRAGRERELVQVYVDELAAHGVHRDIDEVWFDFRVAVGFCFIYGIVSYAQYELLPGEGQHVIDTILRRCVAGITDLDAIAAVRSLAEG
ncbi:MAG: phosphotransferase [Actinomycetota bacterium]